MPSFDVVSEIDGHELQNAVDQANREIDNRFDFKGTDSKLTLKNAEKDTEVLMETQAVFQLKQMKEIFDVRLTKRGISAGVLEYQDPIEQNLRASQVVKIIQGIDRDMAKKITKMIKDSKIKVQSQVQGEQVRVTGKKRDDLQQVMQMLKESKVELPLQYINFRD